LTNLKKYLSKLLFFIIILKPFLSFSQVLLNANPTVDTYQQIRSKGLKLEVPDCMHQVRHVSEVWDDQLKEYVFVFDSHVNLDNDRCRGLDRIRTELTITDSVPPSYLGARDGDTFTYTWKFKLDPNFIANFSFCHIHQIKAVGGSDQGAPIITLSTRAGAPEMLQLTYTPPMGSNGEGVLKEVNLEQFKGVWIEVIEKVTYNINGQFAIVLRKVSDGDTLFSYDNNNINLSRSGAYFYRPKIGIYRSLKNKSEIRDESARFTDFNIVKGTLPCIDKQNHNIAPATPAKITASVLNDSHIIVRWYDNSYNEDHFRIERSLNGTDWTLAALVTPGWERWKPQTQILHYVDSSLSAGTKYYYRIQAENLYGNSDYSDVVVETKVTATEISNEEILTEFTLQSYPNPFDSSTQISYQIPIPAHVQIVVYDSLNTKIATLVDKFQNIGEYKYNLSSEDIAGNQLTNGTYFARLQAGEYAKIIKLMCLKSEF
jgi:hypothetical protein